MTGLNQHAEYRTSGVDWLGEIPAHWGMVKLKNGFDLQKRPAIKSAGIVTAFRDGQVTLRSNRRIDGYTEGDKQIGYQTIYPGDLVIHAMDAFAGAIGVSDSFGQSTPVYSACTPKSGFNSYFYARALRHIALTGYITSLAKGVRERSTDFRWADAKELRVPRPPMEEQDKIVAFLDRETAQIDELIGKQERLIELLAEKRQAIITHAVTKGIDPAAPTKPSGIPWLESVPSHWRLSRMSYEVWVRARLGWKGLKADEYVEEGIAFLSTPNIKGPRIDLTDVNRITPLRFEESPEIQLSVGDVVLAKDGSTLGTVNVVRDLPEPITVNSSIAVLTPSPSVDGVYLYYLLQADFLRNTIQLLKGGMGVPHLFQDDIKRFALPIPPAPEQEAIARYLDDETAQLDMVISKVRAAVELLQERRAAVISAAVTGKIDVREGAA